MPRFRSNEGPEFRQDPEFHQPEDSPDPSIGFPWRIWLARLQRRQDRLDPSSNLWEEVWQGRLQWLARRSRPSSLNRHEDSRSNREIG